jgi:hypothetical protein
VRFTELNGDQGRELINSRQRFAAWRNAVARERGYRGSMVWADVSGHEYLVKSYYDEKNLRRQKSLGRRTPKTEALKATFDEERQEATATRRSIEEALSRQADVNRALGLGRVPLAAARILRALDRRGLLGNGIRVAGMNALYAYEAACGVMVASEIAATGDIDLLYDTRRRLFLVADPELETKNLLDVLRSADRSFKRTPRTFSAENADGYVVDLIKPMRNPPWTPEPIALGDDDDLQAAEIEGLVWLENAPPFEQVVIDERGMPLRMVTPDPRVFALNKVWVSNREMLDPAKRRRDVEQAKAVAELTRRYLSHLSFDTSQLRMLPKDVVESSLRQL